MDMSIRQIFTSPEGRINRVTFLIAFAVAAAIIAAYNMGLRRLGYESLAGFFIALFFPFLAIYVLYCIYAKRLRDMGQSGRLFFLMIIVEIFAVIAVMLMFGGAEYFAEFSQYSRKETIDPEIISAITEKYQNRLTENHHIIRPLLLLVPLAFTAWVALTPSKFCGSTDEP